MNPENIDLAGSSLISLPPNCQSPILPYGIDSSDAISTQAGIYDVSRKVKAGIFQSGVVDT